MRLQRLAGVHGRRWRHGHRSAAVWPDHVRRRFVADAPDRLWVTDIERHEALSNRVEVGDLRRRAVAAVR
jgi:putative transposase